MTLFSSRVFSDGSVVAMAASRGGLTALRTILAAIPSDFPAAIVIVYHLSPYRQSLLAPLLQAVTELTVKEAQTGDLLTYGAVFTAPPDQHLLVREGGILALSSAPKVHFTRPAADPLFVSVATLYGKNAVGVVLTGGLGDGSDGIRAIKESGGTTIAQNEETSEEFSMPRSAIETGDVDFVVPLDGIAPLLVQLVRTFQEDSRKDENFLPISQKPILISRRE